MKATGTSGSEDAAAQTGVVAPHERIGERLDRAQTQRVSYKAQAEQFERQLRIAKEEAAAELEAVRTRVRDLEAEAERAAERAAERVAERARADAQVIQNLQERLEMVEDSTSFRLGHALVLGAKSPRRLAGLPAAAWRLWREARFGGPAEHRPLSRMSRAGHAERARPRRRPRSWRNFAAIRLTNYRCLRRFRRQASRRRSSRSPVGWSMCYTTACPGRRAAMPPARTAWRGGCRMPGSRWSA